MSIHGNPHKDNFESECVHINVYIINVGIEELHSQIESNGIVNEK